MAGAIRNLSDNGGATGQTISINGIDEVLRNLRKLGIETDDLKQLNFEAGTIVKNKVTIPTDTGTMARTLRVAKATRAAKITVGQKNRGWYSTFIEYGTKKLDANPFLMEAKNASLPQIYDHYEKGIDALISKYNLD